jgi:hypothetical protein
MLGLRPLGTTPICALPDVSLGRVVIVATAIVEARLNNPIAELVGDPRNKLVLAVEITAVPLGA